MAAQITPQRLDSCVARLDWTRHLRAPDNRVVRVGELALVANGEPLLATAIGATVVVGFHIRTAHLSGLLHIGFPSARRHRALAQSAPLSFADSGIATLCELFKTFDAAPSDVGIGVVGGSGLLGASAAMDGPQRLLRAVDVALTTHRLVPRQRETGGSRARNVHQYSDGRLFVVMTGGKR